MPEKLNQIEARVELINHEGSNAEGYLYGDVGETWWGGGITATSIRKMLEEANSNVVEFHVNSKGGDVNEGITICNTFRNSDKESHIYVDGEACSSASYMILGATKIFMYDNTRLMVHKPWTFTWGNATDLRKLANDMDKHEESMITTYMSRFRGTEEELKALLEEETYLTAQEAYDLGFCDEVIKFDKKENQAKASVKQQLLSKYRGGIANPESSQNIQENSVNVKNSGQSENNVINKFLNIIGG